MVPEHLAVHSFIDCDEQPRDMGDRVRDRILARDLRFFSDNGFLYFICATCD